MFTANAAAIQADAAGAAAAGLGIFVLIFWGLLILSSIFVLWMLVDCLTSSMPATEKILWLLVILFLHLIGALLYYFIKKRSSVNGVGAGS
jgi:hypothetical protein